MLQRALLILVLCLSTSPVLAFQMTTLFINAEWLWSPHDGRVDGSRVRVAEPSPSAYAEELAFYSKLVNTYKVDVLALAEIENSAVLEDLRQLLGPAWNSAFRQGLDTATGQDVGVITRLPVVAGSVTDFGFPRGVIPGETKGKLLTKVLGLRVEIVSGAQINLVATHLLSKRNDSSRKARQRLRQAYALVSISERFAQDQPLIVVGDLNAYASESPVQALVKGAGLRLAETHCESKFEENKSMKKAIDHALFRGLRCESYQLLDLKQHSDHPGLLLIFSGA